MTGSGTIGQRWYGPAVLAGVVYLVAGIAFGALAGGAATHRMVVVWRLAAWLASAFTFAAHIFYEHARPRTSPAQAALHVLSGVALGACGLAAAANVHSCLIGTGLRPLLLVALVVWPALAGVPAFLVAWAAVAVLRRMHRPG